MGSYTKFQKVLILSLIVLSSMMISWFIFANYLVDYFLNQSDISILKYHQSLNPEERNFDYYKKMVESGLLRFSFFWSFVIILILCIGDKFKKLSNAFINENHNPYALSLFRIITFSAILIYTEYPVIYEMSALPEQFIHSPLGWSGILSILKPNQNSLNYLIPLFKLSLLLSIVGFRLRFFGIISVILGIWILGIPQFYGKINHYHHLLWFAVIAVFAPSNEVLTVEKNNRKVCNSRTHRYFLQLILFSLYVMYFFPGAWKVIGSGFDWLWGEAAKRQIELQCISLNKSLPIFIIDNPLVYKFIGLITVFIELTWGYWMLKKNTRIWMILLTSVFHLSIYFIMDINFWILPIFLLVFLPFDKIFHSRKYTETDLINNTTDVASFPSKLWSKWYLGTIIVFGFFHIDTWPFAVYPSFGNPIENYSWQVSMKVEQSGKTRNVNLIGDSTLKRWLPKTRLLGLHKQIIGEDEVSKSKLQLLDPFYCNALSIGKDVNRVYIKNKFNVTTGAKIDSLVLIKLP